MTFLRQMVSQLLRARAARAMQALCLSMGVFLVCVPLFSQGSQGRITGTITDKSGGVVAGAIVTVKDVQRGVSRTLTTGDSGEYNAPNLLPGAYAVRAEAKGFRAVEQQNILLEVGKEIRVDLSLQPGEVSQTITITEAPPMVETTNATLGGTLSNETINELPLNGRNYINLLSLRPGMTVYAGGGSFTRSANGTRAEDIGYQLEGIRNDDSYTGSSVLNAAIPAGDASTSLPIDAIQEFNTEQNPKAEFGWKPGAIVSAGLKSGTNTLHGTAFMFARTTAFDARNFFDAAPIPKAPIDLKQYGGSVGGAIKKDKLFYFVAYEGQRYSVGNTIILTAPFTVAQPSAGGKGAGLCNNLAAGNCQRSLVDACSDVGFLNVSPLSAHIAGLNPDCSVKPTNYTPGSNLSPFPANDGSNPLGLIQGLVSINRQNNGVAKVDYHVNDHHSLSGMYFRGVGGGSWVDQPWEVGVAGSSNAPFISSLWGYIQAGSGSWTWTPNSTVVNELKGGYNHFVQDYDSLDAGVNPLAYGINTGVTDPKLFGFPLIGVGSPFGFGTFRLGGNWPKHIGPDGSLQFSDHVSVLRGKHAFKFGGEIIHNTADPYITQNGKGAIRFGSLEGFLKGTVDSNNSLIFTGNPLVHLNNGQYAAFLQDDWRVTPRLTVNLGVRYELTTVLSERDNKLANFDPNSATGLVQVGFGETSAFHGNHKNFSPRLGFAWDVGGNGKTVVRGGGSIMYEELPLITFTAVGNQLGLNQIPTGATQVFCSTDPCVSGSTQISRPGPGNMGTVSVGVLGSALTPGWQAQTAACVSGGTTTCGSIFPADIFAIKCGDGQSFVPAGQSAPVQDPAPCNIEALDPNLRTPYISTWTLDIQRAITKDLTLDVAYVGNHGTKLLGFGNINQPPVGAGFCLNSPLTPAQLGTASNPGPCAAVNPSSANPEQLARPLFSKFPYLGEIDQLSNLQKSNYNGLQVTLTQRPTHGLSFLAGYTYSHALDDGSNNFNDITLPPDSHHPLAFLYGNSIFDIRHRLTLTTTYDLPGRKGLGQLLEGWEINSVVTLQSGSPWGAQDFSNDFSGTNQVNELDTYGQAWNFFGNPSDFRSSQTPLPFFPGSGTAATGQETSNAACNAYADALGQMAQLSLATTGCYVKGGSMLVPPAFGTLGNSGRNVFRDSGFRNWDVSVNKEFKIKERVTTQFRAEFFNVLNHPIFSNPNGPANAGFNDPSSQSFGCGCNTPDQAAPNPVLGTGGSRSIQLGLKLIW
jgi:carboxypeptidase family protein/TonB-dependent receptor-like protein